MPHLGHADEVSGLHWPMFPYGGDYSPEQWPRDVQEEDARLMPRAGWNTATLPVFSWALLEPEEGVFDFGWLDEAIERLSGQGIRICLATSTASLPAWLPKAYPEALVAGIGGRRWRHGERQRFCPTSPDFRRLSTRLAGRLAERYGRHPALLAWHISNEYFMPCWCEACGAAFQDWLRTRYASIDELNERWWMRFWGHSYRCFSEIEPPHEDGMRCHQAQTLEWRRFGSWALLEACKAEIEAIRAEGSTAPVTTNMMGAYFPLDYHEWAKALDVVSWDCYPAWDAQPGDVAAMHALMRGLKEGQPFLLLEQSPSQQNWAPYNRLKKPGELRRQSWQAVAHGSDSVMYFQWRRGRGGIEKLHGAVLEHGGSTGSRVFREVAALGAETALAGPAIQAARVPARAAILFSWPNWWALSASSGPTKDLDYLKEFRAFYRAFHRLGIAVEVLSPDADLSPYDLIAAPLLQLTTRGQAERISQRVEHGATLIGTSFSFLTDELDLVWPEGAPGPLRSVFGISVEETDALPESEPNEAVWPDGSRTATRLLADRIELEGAVAWAAYGKDFYAGEPVLTRCRFGAGEGVYLASMLDDEGLHRLVSMLAKERRIGSPLAEGAAPPDGLETAERRSEDGRRFVFLISRSREALAVKLAPGNWTCLLTGEEIQGQAEVEPGGVRILSQ